MILAFIIVLGLIFGSFMNVLIYRLPRRISIVRPNSACPGCHHPIRPYDNIPVLSWILLRGRCRDCNAKIPTSYPLVELLTAFIFAAIYLKFGVSLKSLETAIFCFILIAAAITDISTAFNKDFETGVIPSVYSVVGIIAVLAFAVYENRFIGALAGYAGGFLVLSIPAYIYYSACNVEGIGEGDFTFFALICAFLGLEKLPLLLTMSAIIGLIAGIAIIIATKNKRYPIPFAPALALSAILVVFFL